MPETPDNLTTKAEAGADDKREAGSKPSTGGGGYGARAGEIIRGNLARGGDGKFTSAGNASAAKPKPAAPTTGRRATDLQRRSQAKKPPKGRAAAKPRKGPDPAKAAEREQRRREQAARRAQREADRKRRAAEQQQAKLDRAVAADAKKREQLARREQRLTERQQRAAERAARRTQREAERKLRQQAAALRLGGKGGGGGKANPDKAGAAPANRGKVAAALGVNADALAGLADGAQPDADQARSLEAAGLIEQQRDGSYATTPAGRQFLRAAERGDERQARAMLARGRDQQAARDARRGRTEARPRTTPSERRAKSFAVFKDVSGRDRWLSVSSTTFQDKDAEIVSRKAFEKAIARADASGAYGPLRFWHVPGLDVGDCDFQALYQRSLIESGTFRRPEYAAAVKDGDQISLGFLHPAGQPGPDGVFDDIYIFERSIVPAGRAANPYTRLIVQEVQMLTKEKEQELAARVGPDILATLLAGIDKAEKAADAAGVRHKETRVAVWDEAAQTWREVTEKAAPPPAEDAAMAEDLAGADEELAEADLEAEPADEGAGYVGDMAPAEFMAMLSEGLAGALAPLIEAMNIETKMRGVVDEVKSITGAYATQKDADKAEVAAALKAAQDQATAAQAEAEKLKSRLETLEGDQPRAAGYRASIAPETVVGEDHRLKGAQPTEQPNFIEFFGLGG